MVGLRSVRIGLAIAALAVGVVGAGCLAPPAQPAPTSPASLSISPSTTNFPSTYPPYSYMPNETVTITNTGGHSAQSIVVNGVGVYSVPSNTCNGVTLAHGQSCTADLQFCPSSPNTYDSQLMVTGTDSVTGAALQATSMLDGQAT